MFGEPHLPSNHPIIQSWRAEMEQKTKAKQALEMEYPGLLALNELESLVAAVPAEKVARYKNLREMLKALTAQEQALLITHTPSHPVVAGLRAQIENTERTAKELETAYPGLLAVAALEALSSAAPAPGTNAGSAQAASEVFARRYGLPPPPSSQGAISPEQAFAARYGLAPPAPAAETNGSFTVATNGTASSTSPGPEGLVVTKLTPLFLRLTLDEVAMTDLRARYKISVQNEAAASPRDRNKRQMYCQVGSSNETFAVREVKAPADNPTNPTVVLELNGTGQRVAVAPDHPFQRVEGYMADLKYEPEQKTWANRRVGQALAFARDDYNIIAVTRTAVVLRQRSNGKTWAVESAAAPEAPPGTKGAASVPQVKLLEAGAEPRRVLRLRPNPGDKQTLSWTTEVAIAMKEGEKESPVVKVPAMTMIMDVIVKDISDNGDVAYEMVVRDARVADEPGGAAEVAKAVKSSLARAKGMLAAGTISSRGFSKGVEFKMPPGADAQTREAMDQIKKCFSAVATPLPAEPVGPGARWEVRIPTESQGIVVDETKTCELVSTEGGRLTIKGTTTQHASKQKIQNSAVPGAEGELIKMTCYGTSETTLDLTKLLPSARTADMHSESEMSVNADGQEQTMSMKMDSHSRFEAK